MKPTTLTPQQTYRFASSLIRIRETGIKNWRETLDYSARFDFSIVFPKGNKGRIEKMISVISRRNPGKFAPLPKPTMTDLCAREMWKLIKSRGTSRPTGMDQWKLNLRHRSSGMTLMYANYKYKYSRAVGEWWQNGAWLMGKNDGGWVVRVPPSCQTVDDAIEWMTPAIVHKKISEGCTVHRQGDIWLIPMKIKEHDIGALGWGSDHKPTIDGDTVTLYHSQHETLVATAPNGHKWRAVLSKQIGGGGD